MRGFKLHGNGEHRQRISDELRQLKLMSEGLRTQSLRALVKRHAKQRVDAARAALKAKTSRPAAAA